jgi:hypothetical protein
MWPMQTLCVCVYSKIRRKKCIINIHHYINKACVKILWQYPNDQSTFRDMAGFLAGPFFPNFPYFLTAALIFLIKASKS